MNRNVKLKASSLVETLVAMVLIIIAFSAGMMIYNQVLQTEYLAAKGRAHAHLDHLLQINKQALQVGDERVEIEGLIIDKMVTPSPWSNHSYLLHLQAYDGRERLITELKEIIYTSSQ